MQIFVVDPDPIVSARYLDLKRRNKMIVESTQMMSTALNLSNGNGIYKSTHMNHPCNVWVRQSYDNFLWLYNYVIELGDLYQKQTGKIHKTIADLLNSKMLSEASLCLPRIDQTAFVNCTEHFKHVDNVFEAYKLELGWKWGNDKLTPKFDTFSTV